MPFLKPLDLTKGELPKGLIKYHRARFGSLTAPLSICPENSCRICRRGEDAAAPLIVVCGCNVADFKYVHKDCIQEDVTKSGKTQCERCGFEFKRRVESVPLGRVCEYF